MRWTNSFRGRRLRRQQETEAIIQHESRRIATEAVMHATSTDKKFRRAFRGVLTRAEAETMTVKNAASTKAARQRAEDERYGTTG